MPKKNLETPSKLTVHCPGGEGSKRSGGTLAAIDTCYTINNS